MINDIVQLKKRPGKGIVKLEDNNGVEVNEPTKIAQVFNHFFVNIGQKLSSSFSNSNDASFSLASHKKSFYLKPVSAFQIQNFIKQMDASKSVRPSDPPIKFIKIAHEVLSPILARILNLCIQKGEYPSDLKEACVIPIFKKGKQHLCGNYRPISLISPFSKIFEKCVLFQLDSFFITNGLLSKKQFGFKRNVSTEMALSNVYETFVDNFEKKLITCAVFLDISKAFDSVSHGILLKKLERYGVRGLPLRLLQSYLSGRFQYTLIDGQRSPLLPVTCGVPQGSVLGPFLFSVFINDLPSVTNMSATLFADDACFNLGHENPLTLQCHVNGELEKISAWFRENRLSLNVEKTNFIVIHRRNKPIKLHIKLNGVQLSENDQVKYLGVTIDQKLNWKPQIRNCTSKLSKCLWAITKLRPYTNTSTLKLVYFSLAYPYLQYCISSWGGACQTNLQPLLVKQKLIVKTMLYEKYISPSSPLFLKLGLLKLPEIYSFQVGKLMFNQIRKNHNVSENISSLNSTHIYNTRSSYNQNYYVPSVNSNIGKTSFRYSGPLVWNSLPKNIKTSTKFQFKHLLKNHLLNIYSPLAL